MKHWRFKNLYWDYITKQWEWVFKKKRIGRECSVKGCDGLASRYKQRNIELVCNKCKRRRWRYNNPIKYIHSELCRSAKRRGIYFDIHPGEFIEFCLSNNLYERSSKFSKDTLTVDRIDPELGYTMSNIQVITQSENSKRNRVYQLHKTKIDPEDQPF